MADDPTHAAAVRVMWDRLARVSRSYKENPSEYVEGCMHEAVFAYLDILHLGAGTEMPPPPPAEAGPFSARVYLITQRITFGGQP